MGAGGSAGFQPATPLVSSEAGKMPKLRATRQRVFPQPARRWPQIRRAGVERAGNPRMGLTRRLAPVLEVFPRISTEASLKGNGMITLAASGF